MSLFRIKQIALAKGMTVKSLAESMEIKPQYLSGVINGKNMPSVSTLEKLAGKLDVPVASLFADYITPNQSIIICPHCGGRVEIKTGAAR